jgi:hypothetical protein
MQNTVHRSIRRSPRARHLAPHKNLPLRSPQIRPDTEERADAPETEPPSERVTLPDPYIEETPPATEPVFALARYVPPPPPSEEAPDELDQPFFHPPRPAPAAARFAPRLSVSQRRARVRGFALTTIAACALFSAWTLGGAMGKHGARARAWSAEALCLDAERGGEG